MFIKICTPLRNFIVVKVVLLGLLLFTTLTGAEEIIIGRCDYSNEMEIGETYYVHNLEYPEFSSNESHCKWEIRSGPPVTINCTIEMNHDCNENSLTITFAEGNIFHFCGYKTFFYQGTNPIIQLNSTSLVRGRFECKIKTVDDNCKCGWKKVTRIVGGRETEVNEYPMMAGIVDFTRKIIICGCTIIDKQYVITAAHCIILQSIDNIGIIVGEHDRSTDNDTKATRLLLLDKCMIHPRYDKSIHGYYDVAICKTKENIEYNTEVGPVCLPFQHIQYGNRFGANSTVTALGWGLLDYMDVIQPNTLQKVDLNVTSFEICKHLYPDANNYNICTFTRRKDTCEGDSGGPLLWQNPRTNNLVLVGITSAGQACAYVASIAMRTEAFMDWIKNVTSGAKYCQIE